MADKGEKADIGKNCAACKKVLKKKKCYYRNGAYYCNKNCYKKKMDAIAAKAQEGAE